ncbi:isochorismatase family protein [Streptomyces sp. NPDC007205]|uniref:isochorismatase family protein n=1 Tax=Streptomyces sp. NPDC007205 TaxID=3154316 RepID=UPI00340D2E23
MTAAHVLPDPQRTAPILVDLVERDVPLPLEPRKGTEALGAAEELAHTFRAAGAPAVLVRVERPRSPNSRPQCPRPRPRGARRPVEVAKRTIGAFQGTGPDKRLRERRVTTLVFGGISTNLAVESTARAAADLGYDLDLVASGPPDRPDRRAARVHDARPDRPRHHRSRTSTHRQRMSVADSD